MLCHRTDRKAGKWLYQRLICGRGNSWNSMANKSITQTELNKLLIERAIKLGIKRKKSANPKTKEIRR